jgi:hypothetical protein
MEAGCSKVKSDEAYKAIARVDYRSIAKRNKPAEAKRSVQQSCAWLATFDPRRSFSQHNRPLADVQRQLSFDGCRA